MYILFAFQPGVSASIEKKLLSVKMDIYKSLKIRVLNISKLVKVGL